MKRNAPPSIEVGILKAPEIRFTLNGKFRISGSGTPLSGEGRVLLSGKGIIVHSGGRSGQYEVPLILEPLQPEGSFTLHDVVIGVGFHWEQKEDQEFRGALKLMASDGEIQVVNVISLEEYLVSVISSEMKGDSSPELLKAHTVISRSWLMAQVFKQHSLEKDQK